jgi:hypothetical protein
MQPEEFLLVWCDDDENQSGLHTNFKLSGNGEFLAIVAADGVTILDSVTFPAQTADISYGRYHDYDGDWRYMIPTPGAPNTNVSGAEDEENLPVQFKLYQNYPNPFSKGNGGNAATTIEYSIPVETRSALSQRALSVQLKVYDILGREVATLVNKEQAPGNYSVRFSADNLTSGIYFYRLQAGNFSAVKKMILLK